MAGDRRHHSYCVVKGSVSTDGDGAALGTAGFEIMAGIVATETAQRERQIAYDDYIRLTGIIPRELDSIIQWFRKGNQAYDIVPPPKSATADWTLTPVAKPPPPRDRD